MNNDAQKTTNAQMLRLKAEEQLRSRQSTSFPPENETDIKRLLHELQVHQIELEMQNEELQNAYETAEIALRKYTLLYDLAPMGFFTLDSIGRIVELNFTGADMLKERRFSVIKTKFNLYVTENSLSVFNTFFNSVISGIGKESCIVSLGFNNNPLREVYLEGVAIGEERECLLSVVDLSEIKNLME